MKTVLFCNLDSYYDQEIKVQGFVDSVRDLQYVQFVVIRSFDQKLQITIEKNDENKELNAIVSSLTLESTITVVGILKKNEKVKLNGKELLPCSIEVTSHAQSELPIDMRDKEKTLRETRLDYRLLDLRKEENRLLFSCETVFEQAMREYCIKNSYLEIHSPKITAKAAESGAEVFHFDYFGQTACLSQSPQFYKQMAMASGFDRVFEIGPAFRAENSHTSYHATEINMADFELSWIDSYEDVMDMEEEMLKYSFGKVYDAYGEQIQKLYSIELSDLSIPFPRISFQEAKRILKEEMHFVGEKEEDFERQEEKLLCEYAKKHYGSDFVFVTRFPFSARPFYHRVTEDGLTDSFDLLYRGVEITTGAQREHRYDVLKQQLIEKGNDPKDFQFYLDFFLYGCPPHGGFAIGIARVMMQMLGIDNIREATFIYRGPTRLNP